MEERILNEINNLSAPCIIEQFIGQNKAKRIVKTALDASYADGIRLPHMLFTGFPGLGKTQLANILAKEMGTELQETLAQNLTKISGVQGFLIKAKNSS